ncbi:MAG: 3-dehydroquinate synthase [Tatlockia sp.]|jgi:3-dehydroquinate synthase
MAKFKLYRKLDVHLEERSYPVLIGHGGLSDEKVLRQLVVSKQVLVVTNKTVAPLYLSALQTVFSDRQCDVVILEDGEVFKNAKSLFLLFDTLIEKEHHRDTTLIALGGGVIGDITGFAAATYQRGVPFLQIPTTLLAQVDASVGGKTAINHPKAKNMIGSFYQPKAVMIDVDTLQSLPLREFRAGLAEIIKYALLQGGVFFDLVQEALAEGLALNKSQKLPEIMFQCCKIKAEMVEADERETGLRALLNLGHTFAHALEAYSHYTRWLHGEAVAIGLYCAALLSNQLGLLDESRVQMVDAMLRLAQLPKRIPEDVDLAQLQDLMFKDKKIKNNQLRFILMKSPGDCYLEEQVSLRDLHISLERAVGGDKSC